MNSFRLLCIILPRADTIVGVELKCPDFADQVSSLGIKTKKSSNSRFR